MWVWSIFGLEPPPTPPPRKVSPIKIPSPDRIIGYIFLKQFVYRQEMFIQSKTRVLDRINPQKWPSHIDTTKKLSYLKRGFWKKSVLSDPTKTDRIIG